MARDYEYFKDVQNVVTVLLRDKFWSKIRGDLYKKMMKNPEGWLQWQYFSGVRSRDREGKRIRLAEKNRKYLEGIVHYLNSSDGKENLLQVGILEPPEDTDCLVDILQGAKSDRQIKKEELQLFLKYKSKILRFLAESL
jgi:hypothetical protein